MPDQKLGGRPFGAGSPASRQVSWFEVYRYAERLAASHDVSLNHLPLPGTPAWCGMADSDARKLLALVLGGVREALANDTHQTAMAEASQAISAAADWTAMARAQLRHAHAVTSGAYIPRKAS
ncbi:DUF2742 domain-containing protein [Mycolicibacterium fortuitum]|uniref:DUF2742 domain-containing protein n=1 Tax=Mycolicibacterium fortuitum TaxID=1766 RepID=A0AAE4VEU7_MYCFO|nr:DUF2742 domain-containing protein [Mycolicibacterium fortuitum]MDV7193253.1 DUF2742 domain-containing protein [Mycolicibacterium fortuitum]MDV7206557.1 DUF2742 domain-containing protein [Mycolicibacterium fortuitum]MDV7228084.1 DUF2742 domain-containing protein [Mycolicibacterium fortuitum]MDV7260270.1 DUF2742 domain-containing protein [Mycolicibacterium fortuitum]MDV7285128.1 DUF2742 domain-containing protein [Mycolicibacterium fortuitum]